MSQDVIKAYEEKKDDLYRYLDEVLPKDAQTGDYDLSGGSMLDAQKVVSLIESVLYQADKLRDIAAEK